MVVLPGDGIGPEITQATTHVLGQPPSTSSLTSRSRNTLSGMKAFGSSEPPCRAGLLEIVRGADGLILGPTATFDFKNEQSGEINPSKYFRKNLDLFANVRPARTYPGLRNPLGDIRPRGGAREYRGLLFRSQHGAGNGEMLVTPDVVVSLRRITRLCCERIAKAACQLAMRRKKHLTIVHKANVLKIGDGMFLDICRETASDFPGLVVDDILVDAMMAHVVRHPERFDVIVSTNMFGDILSDLTAELSGSLGLGGSLNVGAEHAMAQAAHGSAPDIAGQDVANPFSLILSMALLLAWHGERIGAPRISSRPPAPSKAR